MKKLKLILFTGIMFLGLIIISPKNLAINAAEPQLPTYYYDSLSGFEDGEYKITINDIDEEYCYTIYFHMEDNIENSFIFYTAINFEYLYLVEDYNYYVLKIENGIQVNINTSINFNELPDGIYSYRDDPYEYAEYAYFRNSYNKIIYEIPYSSMIDGIANNFYSLDYYVDNLKIDTFYIVLIDNGIPLNISNSTTLFNLVSDFYKLFIITEKVDNRNLICKDETNFYTINLPSNNLLDYDVGDYLIYSNEDNIYFTVDKKYVNEIILDGIKQKFNYYVYNPTIIDILKAAKLGVENSIKNALGFDENTLNGLYVVSNDNNLYKIYDNISSYNYFYETSSFNDTYTFIPYSKTFILNDLILNYLNDSFTNNYIVDTSSLTRNYFISFPSNTKTAFFIDGEQIDISSYSLQELLYIYNSYLSYFYNIYDYNNLIRNDFMNLETNTVINNFNNVPSGNGFLRFEKSDTLYNYYFYNNNKFYVFKNLKLLDKLKYPIENYQVNYTFKDNKFMLVFFNLDDTYYWDLISGQYFSQETTYIRDEKELSFYEEKGILYSYINFNFTEPIDKITSISMSFKKRKVNWYAGIIRDTTDWKNFNVTYNSNIKEHHANLIVLTGGINKSLIQDKIKLSNISGYKWQVLVSVDYPDGFMNELTPLLNKVLGDVKTEFKDLSFLQVQFWKDGKFYSKDVVDDFPTDGSSPEPDLVKFWDDLGLYLKKIFNDVFGNLSKVLKIIIYIVTGILGLIIFSIILKIIRLMFRLIKSIFMIKKKHYRRKRR